jgi:hypothetical protein
MIRVRLLLDIFEDEYGPHEVGEDRFVLAPSFAKDTFEAHSKILTLLWTDDYFELPGEDGSRIPVTSRWVRRVVVP